MSKRAELPVDGVGILELSTLPSRPNTFLADRGGDPTRLPSEPLVQLAEAFTYRYRLQTEAQQPLRLEPSELFDADQDDGRSGRFSPGEAVGYVPIEVHAGDEVLATVVVEVRAAKLEYETEFRRMLSDISEFAADALVQGFQPAAGAFEADSSADFDLLYRRFAVLQARISDSEFRAAVAQVLARPHQDWRAEHELRSPSQPLRGGVQLRKALVRGRPRMPRPSAWAMSTLQTLPRGVDVVRHEVSVDTLPNRLVRFALEDWRAVALATAEAVETKLRGGARERGRRATRVVLEQIDEWLTDPLFRKVGRLSVFPQANQVLQKREGYRQIFGTWLVSSAGTDVAIDFDDPVAISQRNVATLYEFWCFLQVLAATAQVAGVEPPLGDIFEPFSGGMALGLRQGKASRLSWEATVAGRKLSIELFFNRTFAVSAATGQGSWSRAMRPDCSIRIRPLSGTLGSSAEVFETWLHFDAKYRVERLMDQFSPADDAAFAADAEESESRGVSKREDLLKMHAYKDAIRRTAGAYVLFPGDEGTSFRVDAEVLPGIGAIPLRPGASGEATQGLDKLESFLRGVLRHAANQASRYERYRYWSARVFSDRASGAPVPPPLEELSLPPADTPVALLRVDERSDYDRLLERREFGVPLGVVWDRLLAAEFVLLYGQGCTAQTLLQRVGPWAFAAGRAECAVNPVLPAPWWIAELEPDRISDESAVAGVVSWLELLLAAAPLAD